MKLGAFSVSLAVKDIHTSKAFYENLSTWVKLKRRNRNQQSKIRVIFLITYLQVFSILIL